MVGARFKHKTYGYHTTTMKIDFANGKTYYGSGRVDPYMKAFVSELASRPSCVTCKFKGLERPSDITIFDCYEYSQITGKKDDDKGYSSVFVHSDKGEKILQAIISSKAEFFAKSAEKNWFVIGKVMVRCIFTVHGKVKTIIVKDFSRFARDYIEAGDYMERIFPLLGVRFISVNDGYDSGMQIGNDVRGLEVAIKNIINASYSRDLSAKIAAADHVMQKKGMYLGGYRPFGFLPDPNDCHKLILDPVASQYVRLIFELALQGNRTGTIAKILNEKQIPTPAAYHVAENHVYSEQKAWDLQRSHWTSGTVYHVLKNEKYKGTYVGAKFIMPVPCKHRVLRAPLEQQVRIEDSHAAIVTPEEFAQAQKVIMLQHGNHQAGNYTKRQYPLKGKVYCGYCRKLMKYRVLKKLGPSFNCRFSATAVDSPCKRIPISEKMLEEIVRNALTVQIKQAEHMLEILHERERKALIFFSALERQEEKLSAEKAELVKLRVALYEQYADGNMSKEEFIRQRDAYRVQEDERMEQIQRLRTEKNQAFQPVKKDTDHLQTVMSTVEEAGDVMHLSQNVVETFIDRIEVFNDERVKIHFTFEDVLADHAE